MEHRQVLMALRLDAGGRHGVRWGVSLRAVSIAEFEVFGVAVPFR